MFASGGADDLFVGFRRRRPPNWRTPITTARASARSAQWRVRRALAPLALLSAFVALMTPRASLAAEAVRCALPKEVESVGLQPPPAAEIQRDVPIASYLLSLSWSPEVCRAHPEDPDAELRCKLNRFGFTVHGLWPNGPDKVHPRYCGEPTVVDPTTLRADLCMTPSRWLLQHEWEAHGTCAWATPQAYFARARALRATLIMPDLIPGKGEAMTAGEVRAAFLARNPGLARDELEVEVDSANRLQEVHVCYNLAFKPAPCLGGGGAPDAATVFVTPEAPR